MLSSLDRVEKDVLHKTYPQDSVDARLSRLEVKLFNTPAPSTMPANDRLQRIISVAMAQNGGSGPGARSKIPGVIQVLLPLMIFLLPLVL
jgi:hypothetical protein